MAATWWWRHIHASGNAYQWDGIAGAKALLNPADPPAWLLEYIAAARDGSRPESKATPGSEKIPKGKRNDHLASLGGTMRKRGMSREAIEAALLEENRLRCDPPLPDGGEAGRGQHRVIQARRR